MNKRRNTGRQEYIRRQRKRKRNTTSSPMLDIITVTGFLIGFFMFMTGEENGQSFLQNTGKVFLVICAYILPAIVMIRFWIDPQKYGRFTAVREEGPSSSTIALGIISCTMLGITWDKNFDIKISIICYAVVLLITLIVSCGGKKRIPENQKIEFYIVFQLFLFNWLYPLIH